jgi:PAS domain S-box-containing protein
MIDNVSSTSPRSSNGGSLPFQKIFDSLPGLYLILSSDLIIQAASNAYLEATFTVREQIIGKHMFEVFPDNENTPEVHATRNLNDSLLQVLSSKKPHKMGTVQYDIPNPAEPGNFTERYWSTTNTPVLNEQEEVVYIIHETINVTEKVKTERQLKESQNREQIALVEAEQQRVQLERFFMQVPVAICTLGGPEMVFELINPTFQALFPDRELLGRSIIEGVPEIADHPIAELLRKVYRTGETYEGEQVLVRITNQQNQAQEDYYFNFVFQALYDAKDKIDGILIFALNLTDLVLTRQQLEQKVVERTAELDQTIKQVKQREQQLQLVIDAVPALISYVDSDYRYQFVNKAYLDWFNVAPEDIIGRKVDDFIINKARSNVKENHIRALKGEKVETEVTFVTKTGEARDTDIQYVPHISSNGEVLGFIVLAVDMTDKIKVRNELAAKNEALTRINADLDNFVYVASHDLKAPILNLEGLLLALNTRIEHLYDQRNRMLAQMMFTSIEKLKNTIKDLTDITKVQKDINAEQELVSFHQVIDDILLDMRPLLQEVNPSISYDIQVEQVLYAPKNLRSVLYNLISNAIKYRSSERACRILIRTYFEDNSPVVEVKDNGLGIDPDHISKLFTMFKRLHTHVEGTGIGLYITKRIIENQGGRIEVKSVLHEGTTFKVYIQD